MQAPMVATRSPMTSAPLLAVGAASLKRSVIAKMPKIRNAVRMISSPSACMGVIAIPVEVKTHPSSPASVAGELVNVVVVVDDRAIELVHNHCTDEGADDLCCPVRQYFFQGKPR